jgi:hypothetical protein
VVATIAFAGLAAGVAFCRSAKKPPAPAAATQAIPIAVNATLFEAIANCLLQPTSIGRSRKRRTSESGIWLAGKPLKCEEFAGSSAETKCPN